MLPILGEQDDDNESHCEVLGGSEASNDDPGVVISDARYLILVLMTWTVRMKALMSHQQHLKF